MTNKSMHVNFIIDNGHVQVDEEQSRGRWEDKLKSIRAHAKFLAEEMGAA